MCIYRTVMQSRQVFWRKITVRLFLRQPSPGWSIPALGAEDSPMTVYVLGHITATRWPTVQTRGKFNACCEILLVTLHIEC